MILTCNTPPQALTRLSPPQAMARLVMQTIFNLNQLGIGGVLSPAYTHFKLYENTLDGL